MTWAELDAELAAKHPEARRLLAAKLGYEELASGVGVIMVPNAYLCDRNNKDVVLASPVELR